MEPITLKVFYKDQVCGTLVQKGIREYVFQYLPKYLAASNPRPISVNLPLQNTPFSSETLFPFFDNLIAEGWLLEAQATTHKISKEDRFGLIRKCGLECVGAVSLRGGDE